MNDLIARAWWAKHAKEHPGREFVEVQEQSGFDDNTLILMRLYPVGTQRVAELTPDEAEALVLEYLQNK